MSSQAVQALRLLEEFLVHRELSSKQCEDLQPVVELLADRLARRAGGRTDP